MRNFTPLVAAAAMSLTTAAFAQSSVTLYGMVDAGVMYQGSQGSSGKSVSSGISGGEYSSRYGLKGVEDLGGGIKAGFTLENAFNTMTGAGSSGVAFSHYANVYLQSNYGRVTAGLQIDPAYLAFITGDPNDASNSYSGVNFWLLSNGLSAAPAGTIYDTNAISYQLNRSNLFVEALYGFGNVAGSFSASRKIALGAIYDKKKCWLHWVIFKRATVPARWICEFIQDRLATTTGRSCFVPDTQISISLLAALMRS